METNGWYPCPTARGHKGWMGNFFLLVGLIMLFVAHRSWFNEHERPVTLDAPIQKQTGAKRATAGSIVSSTGATFQRKPVAFPDVTVNIGLNHVISPNALNFSPSRPSRAKENQAQVVFRAFVQKRQAPTTCLGLRRRVLKWDPQQAAAANLRLAALSLLNALVNNELFMWLDNDSLSECRLEQPAQRGCLFADPVLDPAGCPPSGEIIEERRDNARCSLRTELAVKLRKALGFEVTEQDLAAGLFGPNFFLREAVAFVARPSRESEVFARNLWRTELRPLQSWRPWTYVTSRVGLHITSTFFPSEPNPKKRVDQYLRHFRSYAYNSGSIGVDQVILWCDSQDIAACDAAERALPKAYNTNDEARMNRQANASLSVTLARSPSCPGTEFCVGKEMHRMALVYAMASSDLYIGSFSMANSAGLLVHALMGSFRRNDIVSAYDVEGVDWLGTCTDASQ